MFKKHTVIHPRWSSSITPVVGYNFDLPSSVHNYNLLILILRGGHTELKNNL